MLSVAVVVMAVLVIVAGRWVVRDRVIHPLIDRYGPMPMWLTMAIIAGVIVSRASRVDSTTVGLLQFLSLITFVRCILYLVWPRPRN